MHIPGINIYIYWYLINVYIYIYIWRIEYRTWCSHDIRIVFLLSCRVKYVCLVTCLSLCSLFMFSDCPLLPVSLSLCNCLCQMETHFLRPCGTSAFGEFQIATVSYFPLVNGESVFSLINTYCRWLVMQDVTHLVQLIYRACCILPLAFIELWLGASFVGGCAVVGLPDGVEIVVCERWALSDLSYGDHIPIALWAPVKRS